MQSPSYSVFSCDTLAKFASCPGCSQLFNRPQAWVLWAHHTEKRLTQCRPFSMLQLPKMDLILTENRGWGVKAAAPIPKGTFIVEYAGACQRSLALNDGQRQTGCWQASPSRLLQR